MRPSRRCAVSKLAGHLPVGVDPCAQLRRLLEGLIQGLMPSVSGISLAMTVDVAVGHAQHAPDVAHRRAGLELPEGDDLGDPLAVVVPRPSYLSAT